MDVNELARLFIEETTTIQWPVERCIGWLNSGMVGRTTAAAPIIIVREGLAGARQGDAVSGAGREPRRVLSGGSVIQSPSQAAQQGPAWPTMKTAKSRARYGVLPEKGLKPCHLMYSVPKNRGAVFRRSLVL